MEHTLVPLEWRNESGAFMFRVTRYLCGRCGKRFDVEWGQNKLTLVTLRPMCQPQIRTIHTGNVTRSVEIIKENPGPLQPGEKPWCKAHPLGCILCGTRSRLHASKGRCQKCWSRIKNRNKVEAKV